MVPHFLGWTPKSAVGFGAQPTIYAVLACPKCAGSLKETAGKKLVELFEPVSVPSSNTRSITVFVVTATTLIALGLLILPAWRTWAWLSVIPLISLRPLLIWFNYQTTSLRHHCPCGDPQYKFMGLLGRSYCHRCSTCGKLLRVRD